MEKREHNNDNSKKCTENHAFTFTFSNNVRTNTAEDTKHFYPIGYLVEFRVMGYR